MFLVGIIYIPRFRFKGSVKTRMVVVSPNNTKYIHKYPNKIIQTRLQLNQDQGCHFGRAVLGGRFWAAQYKVLLGSFGHPPFGGREKGEGVKKRGGAGLFFG